MKTWIDFDGAPVFAIPLTDEVDGRTVCEGMLIEGPQGWGEFSPPRDCDDRLAARWLTAAIEVGTVGWPDPVRGRVRVAATIPIVAPDRARTLAVESGCRSAVVHVGSPSLADDITRVEAVRDALGLEGVIRCDADGRWDVDTATAAIPALDRAAGGLEFIEQPCRTLGEIAAVRKKVDVPIAVDQSLRDAPEPLAVDLNDAADIAVLTVSPLGGVRRALRVAETCALPCAASAAVESSMGIAGALALAGVLPETSFAAEVGTARLLDGDMVSPGRSLIPIDGYLPVAPMPPAPDPDRLALFGVTDGATVAWWRQRLDAVQQHL